MKGFLKIFLIILTLAIVAILLVGGICGFVGYSAYNDVKEQAQQQDPISIEKRAKEIANFQMPEGYTLLNAFDVLGAQLAVFQYNPKAQLLCLGSAPWWMMNINEGNFKHKLDPEEMKRALRQGGKDEIDIKDIKILEEGTLQTAGREVPFIRASATLINNQTGKNHNLEGIISVMTFSKSGKNVILISGNKLGTFDAAAVKEFVKTIDIN